MSDDNLTYYDSDYAGKWWSTHQEEDRLDLSKEGVPLKKNGRRVVGIIRDGKYIKLQQALQE